MEKQKFKTNIKCNGCLSLVTPHLNGLVGEDNWQVDLENPDKPLTLNSVIPPEKVIATVKKAGFEAERV